MIKIPSFIFQSNPTRQDLLDCRTVGLIAPAVSTFVDGDDYYQQVNSGPLPPKNGRAKYWANPNINKGIGTMMFTGKTVTGGSLTLIMAMTLSQSQRNFFAEHRGLQIPEWNYVVLDAAEWERLSFDDTDSLVPEEFPLGEVYTKTDGLIEHNFPGNLVLFMNAGKPCACSMDEGFRILRRS